MKQQETGLRPPYLILALCLALVAAMAISNFDSDSGDDSSAVAKGAIATEARTINGDVTGVEITGPVDTVIRVGGTQSIEVEAAESLRPHITTELRDGALRIGFDGRQSRKAHLRARVTLPTLDSLRIAGSGDADVTGLNGGTLKIVVDGSGDTQARGVVDRVDVAVRGSGDVDLNGLSTRDPTVRIQGSGNVELGGITAGTAQVEIRGSGDVTLNGRADRLDVIVAGSGDTDASDLDVQNGKIEIRGDGDVEAHVHTLLEVTRTSGSGNVTNTGAGRVVTSEMGKAR